MRTLHFLSFFDAHCSAKKHAAHIVFLQVHHDGHGAVFELQQLVGLSIAQSVYTGYAVAYGENRSHLVELFLRVDAFELFQQHFRHFTWFYFLRHILLFNFLVH